MGIFNYPLALDEQLIKCDVALIKTAVMITAQQTKQTNDAPSSRRESRAPFFTPLPVQAKLTINAPGDEYEQEADAVADRVMRMKDNTAGDSFFFKPAIRTIQRKCAHCEEEEKSRTIVPQVQRKCDSCADEEVHRMAVDEEEEQAVQRKSGDANEIDVKLESRLSNLGDGQPLSDSARSFFEPRFGQSFSDVRVHTGAAANQAAKSINAKAYTLGNNIAFASGEYDSSSASGRSLIAHELAHTVQQSAGTSSVQRGSAGIFGGKCCLSAPRVEWALVGAGVWKKLEQGECTGTLEDADGMTCGGGFYHVDNGQTGTCSTPRNDDPTFAPRRWTPSSAGASAHSPTAEGSTGGDTPPNYVYDSAATTACPNGVRTISVDMIRLHGSTVSPSAQLATANTVYSGCCIRFVAGATPPQESQADTERLLGGDTDVDRTQGEGCGNVGGEEQVMFDSFTTKHRLSSRMRVFFVASFSPTPAAGYSIPPYCATGAEARYVNYVVLQNTASGATNPLAHEFGHILLNSGNHTASPDLMAPSGGTTLSPTDCATIYGNA